MSNQLKAELTCPICQELYVAPILLNCGHNLCSDPCLARLYGQAKPNSVICPVCHEQTEANQLADFKPNISLRNVIELVREQQHQRPSECQRGASNCQKTASVECLDCAGRIFCTSCSDDVHQGAWSSHERTLITELATGKRRIFGKNCPAHPRYPQDLFCMNDCVNVCLYCLQFGNHQGHTVVPIEEKARIASNRLSKALESVKNKLQPYQGAKTQIEEMLSQLSQEGIDSRKDIEEKLQNFLEEVSKQRQVFIDQTHTKHKESSEALDKQRNELAALLNAIEEEVSKSSKADLDINGTFQQAVAIESLLSKLEENKQLKEVPTGASCKAELTVPSLRALALRYPSDYANKNLFNHVITGGTARIVEYTGLNGASPYNAGTLEGPSNGSWQNNGAMIDVPPTNDDPDLCYRPAVQTGSSWSGPNAGNGIGVMVVDLTSEIRSYRISKFSFFQMTSDGVVSSVRVWYHPWIDQAPPYSHPDWILAVDWVELGAAETVANPPGSGSDGNTVRVTVKREVDRFSARFVKVEARNDGNNPTPNYIELRCLKIFS